MSHDLPALRRVVGAVLPDIALWLTEDDDLVNLSVAHTYTLVVRTLGGQQRFSKADDFTGAAGSGTIDSGTPNLTIAFDLTGELDLLVAGRYKATLTATRTSDSKPRIWQFYLDMDSA